VTLKSASEHIEEVVKPDVPAGPEGDSAMLEGAAASAPKKSKFSRRVEKLAREIADREIAKRLETAPQRAAQPESVAARPKPQRADFADDEAFEDALVKWGVEKAEKEKAIQQAEAAQRQHCERNLRNYAAQIAEAQERYPDWEEVVGQEIHIGMAAQMAIYELETGAADVVYYLGKHPVYAEKLGQMSQASAIMEIGRLSARLQTGASSNGDEYEYRRPKLPVPVRTVSTGGSSEALTFREIAARPAYPGKAKDLKRAAAER
jgi:hypothetical protein